MVLPLAYELELTSARRAGASARRSRAPLRCRRCRGRGRQDRTSKLTARGLGERSELRRTTLQQARRVDLTRYRRHPSRPTSAGARSRGAVTHVLRELRRYLEPLDGAAHARPRSSARASSASRRRRSSRHGRRERRTASLMSAASGSPMASSEDTRPGWTRPGEPELRPSSVGDHREAAPEGRRLERRLRLLGLKQQLLGALAFLRAAAGEQERRHRQGVTSRQSWPPASARSERLHHPPLGRFGRWTRN